MDDTAQSAEQRARNLYRGRIPQSLPTRSVNNSARNGTPARKRSTKKPDTRATTTTRSWSRSSSLEPHGRLTASSSFGALNGSVQKRCYFSTREVSCGSASDHHNLRLPGQPRSCMSKPLSNTAFYAVADYRVAHPFTDRDAQSMPLLVGFLGIGADFRRQYDDKTPRNPTFPGFDYAREILSAQDAVRPPKAARFRKHKPTSRGYWLRGACDPLPDGV